MSEDPKNMQFFCHEHGPKPDPKLQKKPIDYFVGKLVKLAFATLKVSPFPVAEHMWVRVDRKIKMGDKYQLTGFIANEPVFAEQWRFGQEIVFEQSEIEQCMKEKQK